MNIGSFHIGRTARPFVIAEMSGNHNQSLDRALRIVEAAAHAGAHALKLQTYTADTMTIDLDSGEFHIQDAGSLWNGNSLYRLYQQAYTPWEWHAAIFEHCRKLGLICFSTPFDASAVDFLESLEVPCYKIASFENADLPLIRKVAATGKPLIISTGMATVAELDETVRAVRESGGRNLVLLKCTSTYPASPENTNNLTIPHMRELFGCDVGISDHTLGIGASLAAVALGACVIEKHFTLSRAEGGVDAAFSIEPSELKSLVDESLNAWQSLGRVHYGQVPGEAQSLRYRRSLYVVRDVCAGEAVTAANVRAIRPGYGLAPKFLDQVQGRAFRQDTPKGTPLAWELLG